MNLSRSPSTSEILETSWFQGDEVTSIARKLLGKVLVTNFAGLRTSGIIVETEAYNGVYDKACHAYGGRRTPRTEVMYAPGGVAYVYLCYGIHHLFNVITNNRDIPDAVLIRAVQPIQGIETMLERRKMQIVQPKLTAGPGILSQALGITLAISGQQLTKENNIWIENSDVVLMEENIEAGTRVGIGYAGEDALLPWRFSVKGNIWKSPAK